MSRLDCVHYFRGECLLYKSKEFECFGCIFAETLMIDLERAIVLDKNMKEAVRKKDYQRYEYFKRMNDDDMEEYGERMERAIEAREEI